MCRRKPEVFQSFNSLIIFKGTQTVTKVSHWCLWEVCAKCFEQHENKTNNNLAQFHSQITRQMQQNEVKVQHLTGVGLHCLMYPTSAALSLTLLQPQQHNCSLEEGHNLPNSPQSYSRKPELSTKHQHSGARTTGMSK